MSELPEGVHWCTESRCWNCGWLVKHKPFGGPQRFHWCSLRWLSRARWKAHFKGWHEGYRHGIENYGDPMVQADVFDYGSGWAGLMNDGHVTIVAGEVSDGRDG